MYNDTYLCELNESEYERFVRILPGVRYSVY
jgi:hypothetical protein